MQASPIGTLRLAWRHCTFQVPRDWEVVAFNKPEDKGRLILADRHGERMQMHWRRMENSPPLRSRMEDWVREQPAESLPKKIAALISEQNGWTVFLPKSGSIAVLAARHIVQGPVLINMVFPPRKGLSTHAVAQRVLASFEPNYGPERAWAAFGLDLKLPSNLDLQSAASLPALQHMRFEDSRGTSVIVHRFGMLDALLARESIEIIFGRVKEGKVLLKRSGEFQRSDGRSGLLLSYETRDRRRWGGLWKSRREGRVWLWRCDELQRLFSVDVCVPRGSAFPSFHEKVACQ